MSRYEEIVRTLIEPLVREKDALLIRETTSSDDRGVTINVFGAKEDIAVLIGRKGSIATALRETLSIAGKLDNTRIYLKLESLGENN